ncbi:hypothetical protein [Streptomyces goshikiensis]
MKLFISGKGGEGVSETMTTENERQLPQQAGAAYEVARDVLLQLIGHAVGRVVTGGEEWAGKRDRWSSLLSRLDPWDAIPPRNSGP